MKIEEINLISTLPKEDMTNKEWQEYFKKMKTLVQQEKKRRMTLHTIPMFAQNNHNSKTAYYGDTQWAKYREFINSILYAMRCGEQDYCFYTYQIADLLRYEHDNLRTRWLPEHQCFIVWLKK